MSKSVGKSVTRVDAYEKATGRAKYVADLCDQSALVARILHATIAHGYVKSIDTTEAEAVPGVVKVLTCFNVPDYRFPTAGHPWSTDPAHQDVADRLLLNHHVRYYGDDIAAVIAENEIAAAQAVRALKVEYEELPFVLDVQKAMEPDAPQIHEDCPGNVLKHTDIRRGDYQTAIQEPGLIRVEGWYDTPTVQHCHIENHGCFAYEEAGRVVVVTSTQIPHIIRRVVGQALGLPWGKVRIIKPYIGGGFGNKQDALYEPLCAWLSTQVGGRLVHLECSREETFVSNRVRHAIRTHIISYVRPAPWWPGSLRPGPTRGPTPPTATASWPRAWAPSPSSTPATIWSATAGRSTPTAPPPVPCVVMGSPRPCGPGSATSTISVRLSGWSLWNSAGRI